MRPLAGLAAGVVAGLGVLAPAGGAAAGHMAYLAPLTFAPKRDVVTIEAGMSEEAHMFVPDFPIRGAGDFTVTGADGQVAKVTAVTTLREMAVLEAPLPAEGTYRISTGERPGRSAKWAKIEGAWRMVRPAGAPAGPPRPPGAGAGPIEESALPPGAEVMTSESFLRADLYVSRGAPQSLPKPVGKGLEIAPLNHPNDLYAGDALKFQILNDGQPVAGALLTIVRANDAYADEHFTWSGVSQTEGQAVSVAKPGVYVLQAQFPQRVEGAPPLARSATTTLTFEVTH